MTHRVGPKGQVVIPKELRDDLGIMPGDLVEFWREGDHVIVRRAVSQEPLFGRFRGAGLAELLAADRVAERAADRTAEDRLDERPVT
jgi:AbrB family looped-hinge helix DNA binding protein